MEIIDEKKDEIVYLDQENGSVYTLVLNDDLNEWKLRLIQKLDENGNIRVDTTLDKDGHYDLIVISQNNYSREVRMIESIVVKDLIINKNNNEKKTYIAHEDNHMAKGITINKYIGEKHVFVDDKGTILDNPLTNDKMIMELFLNNAHLVDQLKEDKGKRHE